MTASIWRIIRLTGLGFAGFTLLMVGIAATIAFQDFLSKRFERSYAIFESGMEGFLETASGSRNKPDSALNYDALKQVVDAPKILAISTQVGTGDSGWVKRRQQKVDPIMLSMPKEWLPKNSEEVNIIVACSWSTEYFGEYSNGAKGYIDSGRFVGYDLKTGTLLFEGTAVGREPPSQTKTTGAVYGRRADAELVEQIRKGLDLTRAELEKLQQSESGE